MADPTRDGGTGADAATEGEVATGGGVGTGRGVSGDAEPHMRGPDSPEPPRFESGGGGDGGGSGPSPRLPWGRRVVLGQRGTTFVREVAGPPGAPTVVLLHGLAASGGLNWFQAFDALGAGFRVLAPDLRGHGRGIRSRRRVRLADCADDVAVLCEALETGPVIAVGYSMGGPVAQLLWRRHPELVAGLVFCATADRFVPGARERLVFVTAMSATAGSTRLGQAMARAPTRLIADRVPVAVRSRPSSFQAWARAEMGRHDWRMLAEAAHAVGTYDAGRWIGEVDVPTAVLVTTEDRAIPPTDQARLAVRIGGATLHKIDDGHTVCARRRFAGPLVEACADVAGRIGA